MDKGNTNHNSLNLHSKNSIYQELKNALKGIEVDYTQISIKRAIFLLAIPMILELVMESTFAVADIFFIGGLGASAIATVGLTETYLFLIYSLGMGLSMAVTAIVARRIGEKNKEEASKAAMQSVFLAILISLPFAIAGIFYSKELLLLMGGDEWSQSFGFEYTQWMLGGNGIIILLFVINAIFRGAGNAAIAMKVLWIANTINILLDPILIYGWWIFPEMGIQGAAVATNIGRGTAVLVQFLILFKGTNRLKFSLNDIKLRFSILMNIIKTSLGGVGQMIVAMTSWIFLMRILSEVGSEAVAGSTVALRIMMFTLMPAWGLSNAAATLVGQNLGSESPDRAEDSVMKIGYYNMMFLIIVSVVYFVFNIELMGIFTDNQNVINIGAEWLQILSYSYLVYGWWMVSVQAFNGSGDTRTPTLINIVFFWLIQIPLSYYLAIYLEWQHSGVFWAVFLSETTVGIFTFYLFKKGKWKTYKV